MPGSNEVYIVDCHVTMVDKGPLTSTSIRVAPSTFKFNWCTRVEKAKSTNWHLFGFFLYSTDDYRPSQKKRHITQKLKLFSHSWLCIQCGRIPTCPGDVAPLWFRLCKYYTLVSFQYVTVCSKIWDIHATPRNLWGWRWVRIYVCCLPGWKQQWWPLNLSI